MMGYASYRGTSFSGGETGAQLGYPTDPTAGLLSPSDDPTGAAAAAAAAAAVAANMPMSQMPQQHTRTSSVLAGTHTTATGPSGLPPQYMASQEHISGRPISALPSSSITSGGGGGSGSSYLAPAPHRPHTIAPAPLPSTAGATAASTAASTSSSIVERSAQQPHTSPQIGTTGGGSGFYDPYAHILNKANLRVEGNLDTMLENWTEEERRNQRRLVQFWRRQSGNEVICSFSPVSQSERPQQQSMIVVSCIYWQDRNDYFITSVDCIYLLESLIAVRFTVEEKNRIRRNLEGFRPLTVSKLRQDSADFFKLIMAFPNPKPRNIEKDVKVFPWRSLGLALKKIISKYTASYSSTASVNLDVLNYRLPTSSAGEGGGVSATSDAGEGSSSTAAQQQNEGP
ncbi:hypothetical protein BX666DRAFT_2002521 [Dichotomocladium elegans]|nr:hypothetical protein BX666DRAFT_2002521 [Dichotomocladium elegans]